MSVRLALALDEGGLVVPDEGRIAAFHPRQDHDLGVLEQARVDVIQPFFPDHHHFDAAGYTCMPDVEGAAPPFAASVVFLPRAKALARALIAQASGMTQGPVIVDGAKTEGIDSLLRDLRKRGSISGPVSKAHGKLFWFDAPGPDLSDWIAPATAAEGFRTAPGVFSADGIDPASRLLAEALPGKLSGHVADLGAGWGYLSARILEHGSVKALHLVEADHTALACARVNAADPRAMYHWADAREWTAPGRLDVVVMNPPFHTARRAEPDLGRAFVAAAARVLAPSGQLWMVANRHLPYESALREKFAEIREIGGDGRFKLLFAARPIRAKVR